MNLEARVYYYTRKTVIHDSENTISDISSNSYAIEYSVFSKSHNK